MIQASGVPPSLRTRGNHSRVMPRLDIEHELPPNWAHLADNYRWIPETSGYPGADVYRLEAPAQPSLFAKIEPAGPFSDVLEESIRLRCLVGNRLSIADIHLFRLFWRFRRSSDLDLAELLSLVAHHNSMMRWPAVRATCAVEAGIGYELPV